MTTADAVIWSFPLYYALVSAQMKRFVELLFGRCPANGYFPGAFSPNRLLLRKEGRR